MMPLAAVEYAHYSCTTLELQYFAQTARHPSTLNEPRQVPLASKLSQLQQVHSTPFSSRPSIDEPTRTLQLPELSTPAALSGRSPPRSSSPTCLFICMLAPYLSGSAPSHSLPRCSHRHRDCCRRHSHQVLCVAAVPASPQVPGQASGRQTFNPTRLRARSADRGTSQW